MRLFLVRHAHATSDEEHPLRPLNDRGRRVAAAMALWLRPAIPEGLAAILHSPLERSRETAVILADAWGMRERLHETRGLLPEDEPLAACQLLAHRSEPMLIVGHEPHLGRLVSLLLTGNQELPLLLLKKGSVCCLRRPGGPTGPWVLEWMIKPKLIAPQEEA